MPTAPRDLEAQADELLLRAELTTTSKPAAWAISSSPEREAEILAGGMTDEDIAEYARELRTRHDPRGELAYLLSRGERGPAENFIKARRKLLFASAGGHARLRHMTLEHWASGFLVSASLRIDKVKAVDLRNFLWAPATRFLKQLRFNYIDENDDFVLKLRRGQQQLVHACNEVCAAPCRSALEVVHVRSIDPRGQPQGVLAKHRGLSVDAVRPLKRLREFKLVFDSE